MTGEATNPAPAAVPPKRNVGKVLLWLGFALVIVAAFISGIILWARTPSPPSMEIALGDGRILKIDKTSYGTHHQIGRGFPGLNSTLSKLPAGLRKFLGLSTVSVVDLTRPALVLWVSAIDSKTGTNIDCSMVRMQLVDKNGESFPEDYSPRWFPTPGFWREAHIFYNYPKWDTNFTLELVSLRKAPFQPISTNFSNPFSVVPAKWAGQPLPQISTTGGVEIVLTRLDVRDVPARGMSAFFRKSPLPSALPTLRTPQDIQARMDAMRKSMGPHMRKGFWPIGEVRQDGRAATGWSAPEWMSEDPYGNRESYPSTDQLILKFFATVYPKATNNAAIQLLATLPSTDLITLTTNAFWNQRISVASNEVFILGFFLAGTHSFSNGTYLSSSFSKIDPRESNDTSPTKIPRMRPPSGTGWDLGGRPAMTRGVPIYIRDHFSASHVIYLKVKSLPPPNRIGVRIRDNLGRYSVARGDLMPFEGIYPFFVELPADATNAVPEIVLLKPLQTEFVVDTSSYTPL